MEQIWLFANNINVPISDTDAGALPNKVDQVIIELEFWLQRNELIINVGKTMVTLFHNRQEKCPVRPQGPFIKMNIIYTADTKFLGVILRRI
jgi:hypothetical protein